jgi:hypothetical protein
MKMRRYPFLLALVLFIMSSCAMQKKSPEPVISITPLSDTVNITRGALIYALPMTIFEIDITLQRTVDIPGPYAPYAADLIGINDVIRNESEEWSLLSVALKPLEEIDPSEYYVIESNTFIQANTLIMSGHGLIMDIGKGNTISRDVSYNDGDSDFAVLRFSDLGSTQYFSTQRDTAYRVINADTTFIRIPYLVERRRQLTTEQLAERAAKTLLELREGRHLILTGEATVFPQSEAPINEINRLEKEYLSLFTGKTMNEMVNLKIYYTPASGQIQDEAILFRLSPVTGVTDEDDTKGHPVSISLTAAGKTRPLVLSSDLQSLTSAPEGGLVYRIPEVVDITINEGTRTLLRTRTLIHQYGQKVILPQSFLLGR